MKIKGYKKGKSIYNEYDDMEKKLKGYKRGRSKYNTMNMMIWKIK